MFFFNYLSWAHSNLQDWRQAPVLYVFHQKIKLTYTQESHINMKEKVTWQRGTSQELRHELGNVFPPCHNCICPLAVGYHWHFWAGTAPWEEAQLKQLSLTLKCVTLLGFQKTGNAEKQRCLRNTFFISSSPAPGQLSPEDYMVPTGGGGTKFGLPVGTSPFMLLVQYDFIAPREKDFLHVHLALKCTSKGLR